MADGRLAGRVALVTGTGRGFGRAIAELPPHRFGSVDDVADCAIVLASDEAGHLTGQILHPSGGWVSG